MPNVLMVEDFSIGFTNLDVQNVYLFARKATLFFIMCGARLMHATL